MLHIVRTQLDDMKEPNPLKSKEKDDRDNNDAEEEK